MGAVDRLTQHNALVLEDGQVGEAKHKPDRRGLGGAGREQLQRFRQSVLIGTTMTPAESDPTCQRAASSWNYGSDSLCTWQAIDDRVHSRERTSCGIKLQLYIRSS